ncbi:MAG: phosphatase PAP2 family protein [Thermoplasmata archaeon]|jgi:membrane-associated phospholipid phosphatase|nr:phosphatase PAP2 family protein [Thermoplasmata archaeon]
MAITYGVFFALFAATMVIAVFVGLLILVGWKDMWIRKTLRAVKYNLVYIVIIAAFPLFVQVQDVIERSFEGPEQTSKEIVYTNWIFGLAGGAIRVLQDRLDYRLITDFFIIIYAWLFAFFIYFVPIILLVKDDRATLRDYSIATMINYIILTPFYFLFPVTVSGSYPESGMTPQLYITTHWGKMVTSVDPLNNDFPSGHVSLMVTTLLVFAFAGREYRAFTYFLIFSTVTISFAVLYLGIHWPADVFAGFVLGVTAVVIARNQRVQMTVDRYVRKLNAKLFKEKPEALESSGLSPKPE